MSGNGRYLISLQPRWVRARWFLVLAAIVGLAGTAVPETEEKPRPRRFAPAIADSVVDRFTLVRSEPMSNEYFPCSDCHESGDEVNPIPRVLEDEHSDKKLSHGESTIWCLDCHDRDERDHLHGASGNPIPFEDSHKLCGQCHGRMYQEWKRGVHGKRVGFWSGEKEYYTCLVCHNPHAPHFKPIEPKPAPKRPDEIR